MGYYGEFDVNIVVKPGCIPALEAALDASETFGGKQPKTLDEHMAAVWADTVEVDYGDDSPLQQLAGAASGKDTRTARITGYSHQKWRSWIDDLMRIIAPFVEDDSAIDVRGEQHELVRYYIEKGGHYRKASREVWDDEYEEMRLARGAIAAANEIIRSYFEDGYEDAETTLRDLRTCIAESKLDHLKP